jgi:hypothetical protein
MWGLILACSGIVLLGCLAALFSILLLRVREARQTSKQSYCFYCGSKALRHSAPKGLVDHMLANWDCLPHRCEVCFRRYYRFDRGAN